MIFIICKFRVLNGTICMTKSANRYPLIVGVGGGALDARERKLARFELERTSVFLPIAIGIPCSIFGVQFINNTTLTIPD